MRIPFERHERSVLVTAKELAELASGTLDGISNEQEVYRVCWLAWRIDEGWQSSVNELNKRYDQMVRKLAREAIWRSVTSDNEGEGAWRLLPGRSFELDVGEGIHILRGEVTSFMLDDSDGVMRITDGMTELCQDDVNKRPMCIPEGTYPGLEHNCTSDVGGVDDRGE